MISRGIAALFGAAFGAGLTGSAGASPIWPVSPADLYVHARAAVTVGDIDTANADFAALLAHETVDPIVVQRAYRQSIVGGDAALAIRAARLLERQGTLPPDGRLLLAIDAIRARKWPAARAETDLIEKDRLFAFMAPLLRAWIALGMHDGDPLARIEQARALSLAGPYVAEQRALMLIALGRIEEGVAALRGPGPASLDRLPTRVRLILADALAGNRQKERALGLLEGDDPALAAARARIAAGARLPERIEAPADGVAALLINIAVDLGRQRLAPIALTMARFATFVAPQDASALLLVANLLAQGHQGDVALAALASVAPDDPLAVTARALRIDLLAQRGDKQAALADALKPVRQGDAGAADWARAGDVYMSLDRPADAAAAYGKALEAALAAKLPNEAQWPLLLQQADALDRSGDWAAARAALRKALALAPNQPLVLNQLGYSQIAHREDVAQASGLIQRASQLRPDDPAITDSLGWSWYLRGDVAQAVPLLEKAIAGNPVEPTINEHLGDAYWSSGRLFEARYAWRAALVTADDKDKARLSAKIDTGLTAATASP